MPKPAVPPSACLVGAVPPSALLVGAVSPSALLVGAVPPSAFLVAAVPPSAPPGGAGRLRPASEGRSRAAATLHGSGRPAAAPLLDALADDDLWVRWRAAWALSTLAPAISSGSDEAARLLEAARRESDPRVRIWLERAGARLGAERREAPPSRATPEPRSTGRWLTPSGRIMRPPTPWSWPEPRSTTCFCRPSPT